MLNNNALQEAIIFLKLEALSFEYVPNNKEHSISVVKKNNRVTIHYSELITLFYGLSIVKMNIAKDEFEIHEERKFIYNGSMFDCSRNQALNLFTIKEMILVHALMGLNRFMLYTEDVYEIDGEPYFGYFRGRYTKNEIKEICNYAKGFGVDVIPCIQTLSHLGRALRWSPYYPFQDTSCTLDVENNDIYAFIEKIIKTSRENFDSEYIHIGMDEAIDMGTKAYQKEKRQIDKTEYMLKHLNKVIKICEKYNFKPMMWIDMFYKIGKNGIEGDWYNYKGYFEKEIKDQIPDVELIYWNYYDDQTDRYDQNLKTAKDTGKFITFAGGLIRWAGMTANITPSLRKASAGLKTAVKHNVQSVFATTWGDSASGATAVALYPMLALHNSFDYQNGSISKASRILKAVTGLSMDEWIKLELPNHIRKEEFLPFENPCMPFMYQDVLQGIFDTRVKYEYEQVYSDAYRALKKVSKKSERFGYSFKTYASMCDFLSIKATLGKRLREQYQAGDKKGLAESLTKIKLAIKKMDIFIKDYSYMWKREAKPFGLEINDGRLGFTKQRLISAYITLDDYLKGKTDSIPELEEKILPFNAFKDEEAHCFNYWNDLISVNNNI